MQKRSNHKNANLMKGVNVAMNLRFLLTLVVLLLSWLSATAVASIEEELRKSVVLPEGSLASDDLKRLLCETSYPSGVWVDGECRRDDATLLSSGDVLDSSLCTLLGCRKTDTGCTCKEVSPLGGIVAPLTATRLVYTPRGWVFVAQSTRASDDLKTLRFGVFEISPDYTTWNLKIGGDISSENKLYGVAGPYIYSDNRVQLLVSLPQESPSSGSSSYSFYSYKSPEYILDCINLSNCNIKKVLTYYYSRFASSTREEINSFTYFFESPSFVSDFYYVTTFFQDQTLYISYISCGRCGRKKNNSGTVDIYSPLGFAGASDLSELFSDDRLYKLSKSDGFVASDLGIFLPKVTFGVNYPYQEGYLTVKALTKDSTYVFPFLVIATPDETHFWVSETGNYFVDSTKSGSLPYGRTLGYGEVNFALKNGDSYLVLRPDSGGLNDMNPVFYIDWTNNRTIISGDHTVSEDYGKLFVVYSSCTKKIAPSSGSTPFLMECEKSVNDNFVVEVDGRYYLPHYVRFFSDKALLVYDGEDETVYFEIPVDSLFDRTQSVGRQEIYLNFPAFVQNDVFNYYLSFTYPSLYCVGYWRGCWRSQTKETFGSFTNRNYQFSSIPISARPATPSEADDASYVSFSDTAQAVVSFEGLNFPKIYKITAENFKSYTNGTCSPQPSGQYECSTSQTVYSSLDACEGQCEDVKKLAFCYVSNKKLYCKISGESEYLPSYTAFKNRYSLLYYGRYPVSFRTLEDCKAFLEKYYPNSSYFCSGEVSDYVARTYGILGRTRTFYNLKVATCEPYMNYLCEETGILYTGDDRLENCTRECIVIQE